MEAVRVDKWLWAARFYKTRALATDAVLGGHVQVNGLRAKPAKDVRVGDALQIRIGTIEWIVDVRGLADRRGPATRRAGALRGTAGLEGSARAAGHAAPAREADRRRPRRQADEAGPTPARRAPTSAAASALSTARASATHHQRKPDAVAGGCHVRVSSDAICRCPAIDGQHLASTSQMEAERPDQLRGEPADVDAARGRTPPCRARARTDAHRRRRACRRCARRGS